MVVAVTALLGYVIAFSGVYVFVANDVLTEVLGNPHAPGLLQLTTILYGALVAVPAVLGVRVGLRLAIAPDLFEVAVLAVFVVAVLVQGGDRGSLSLTPFTLRPGAGGASSSASPSPSSPSAASRRRPPLAEETENPRRNVPIAVMAAIAISAVISILSSYAVVEAFGDVAALTGDAAPFVTASQRFIPILAPVAVWLLLTSVTSSFLAANTETSRVVFSTGREGLLPRWRGAVAPRYRTPWATVLALPPACRSALASSPPAPSGRRGPPSSPKPAA